MASHHRFDCFRSLVGVVEGNGADVVVQHVSLDNAVEELTANKAEFTIDGSSCTACERPGVVLVVGQAWVGVL